MSAKINPPPPQGGILNCRKPVGPTSLWLVNEIKRLSAVRKVGHCGTLDPFADGVLPIALGRATNMIRYMDDYDKVYRVLIHLGEATDTADLSGSVIGGRLPASEECLAWSANDFAVLRETIGQMTGLIEQETPAFSAAKIAGRPMYEYARAGIAVEGKIRQVEVFSAELQGAGFDLQEDGLEALDESHLPGEVFFPGTEHVDKGLDKVKSVHKPRFWLVVDIHCSKGTYIRTWAAELGQRLGCGAYAARLRRLRSGPYSFDDAVRQEDLRIIKQEGRGLAELKSRGLLRDASTARPDFPVIELDLNNATRILQGKQVFGLPDLSADSHYRVFCRDLFLGIGVGRLSEDTGVILVAERMFTSLENFESRFDEGL
ncbi:MAG: tRNA pseudouridine(55) synthase TruB [Clostridia bacterium]|nr:tRNA pseudouridine(55) synthase TruB [Clostridia bacterium]NLF21075.1 tRNA pseudouridine(55) synthase TruB [Clostridiaceae bacterium]